METPNVPVNYVPAKAGETLHLGKIIIRIMEDGSRTDNRIGAAEFTVPANTPGPIPHWHEMVPPPSIPPPTASPSDSRPTPQHDETFLVTAGTLRFHLLSGETVDAAAGDYVVVPPRAPHTFSNPFDEPAKFFNTYTPAYYINYFKILSTLVKKGEPMTAEANRKAMAYFATIGVAEEEMKKPEDGGK